MSRGRAPGAVGAVLAGTVLAGTVLAGAVLASCSTTPAPEKASTVVVVHDSGDLAGALSGAVPGETIRVAPGSYPGSFTASATGTRSKPIVLTGTPAAVLDGGTSGYTLHLDNASWWRIRGVTIKGGQKGIVLDGTTHTVIRGVHVTGTEEEGVHLRSASSDDTLEGLRIDHTGLQDTFFGEAVYIGSALENWCQYSGCKPDHSNGDQVLSSTFGPDVTAQDIDVKEGTSGGRIVGNHFSGVGMTDSRAWVQVKGNGWTVDDNVGSVSSDAGFQVLELVPGWGRHNVFESNTLDGPARGYAIWIQDGAIANVVGCSNRATGFRAGLANRVCTAAGP
ncbi:MAG TPA: right-handed parallel beta-helix repeat-containing protein [Acidimicrobiales bacterium]|nr:right-handed parallel beta-helix repeat-containing protein [Acidimicrobiales bacterium]